MALFLNDLCLFDFFQLSPVLSLSEQIMRQLV